MSRKKNKNGFSLLEVLVVVIIIGIIVALGFSSMSELVQTNRAKEASRMLTAFVERAVAESKMRKEAVSISIDGGLMLVHQEGNDSLLMQQLLPHGYEINQVYKPEQCGHDFFNAVTAQIRIGTSGIYGSGCFVVCKGIYCGSAVKTLEKNSFSAYIKRSSGNWEAL